MKKSKTRQGEDAPLLQPFKPGLTAVPDATLEDSPLQASWGWWPWSPATRLVPRNLFLSSRQCPARPGQCSQTPQAPISP